MTKAECRKRRLAQETRLGFLISSSTFSYLCSFVPLVAKLLALHFCDICAFLRLSHFSGIPLPSLIETSGILMARGDVRH